MVGIGDVASIDGLGDNVMVVSPCKGSASE